MHINVYIFNLCNLERLLTYGVIDIFLDNFYGIVIKVRLFGGDFGGTSPSSAWVQVKLNIKRGNL